MVGNAVKNKWFKFQMNPLRDNGVKRKISFINELPSYLVSIYAFLSKLLLDRCIVHAQGQLPPLFLNLQIDVLSLTFLRSTVSEGDSKHTRPGAIN